MHSDPLVARWYACMFSGMCARVVGGARVRCVRPSPGAGVNRRSRVSATMSLRGVGEIDVSTRNEPKLNTHSGGLGRGRSCVKADGVSRRIRGSLRTGELWASNRDGVPLSNPIVAPEEREETVLLLDEEQLEEELV